MCGLVGCAGNITNNDKKALMLLLRFDVTRGWDSTGLGIVTAKDNEIKLHKEVGPPEYLFAIDDEFDGRGVYSGEHPKVMIGHNRYATKGKVTKENAHPFVHDGILGAHNGTLTSISTLERGKDFDVDSEAIFWNLSQYEVTSVIGNIWGAYALTWYDDGTEKLYIIRNGERPLFWTRRVDKDVIFWASEEWMLTAALRKSGINHGPINSFATDTLYTLDMSDCTASGIRKVDWERIENVKGYTPPPVKVPPNNKGGKKSNIIPFAHSSNASTSSPVSKADKMMMSMLVDTEIRFKFGCVKKGLGTQEYIHAYPANFNLDFDIRIFGQKHVNWEYWCSKMHNTVFKGRIKRVVHNNEGSYFIIDLRSLRPAEDKVEEPINVQLEDDFNPPSSNIVSDGDNAIYEGFRGVYLTKWEWEQATKKGCAGCGCDADDHDADLVFIDHDEFLCGINKCCETYAEHIPAGAYR